MSVESDVCHHCNKQWHYKRDCLELVNGKGKRERTNKHSGGSGGSGSGAGQSRCSFDNTKTHSDVEWIPRPHQGRAYITCSTQYINPLPPDGDSKISERRQRLQRGFPVHRHNCCVDLPTHRPIKGDTDGRLLCRCRAFNVTRTTTDNDHHHYDCCSRNRHDRWRSVGMTESLERR